MTTAPDSRWTPPDPDPLKMARNCVKAVARAAEIQASDDPDTRLLAYINKVGEAGDQASRIAARMALVSIAEDLRFVAEHWGMLADWEPDGRDSDGNLVLKNRSAGGRYVLIPEEDR
jgi:hypothetical protein